MNWLRRFPRQGVMVVATVLLPVLLLCYLLLGLLGLRGEYRQEVQRLEPRIARLEGLLQREEDLRQSAERVASEVSELVYSPSDDRASVSAALQSSVRGILADAGMNVANSQILPIEDFQGFDRLAVKLVATGDLPQLDGALADIAAFRPLLLVEQMDIRPSRQRRGNQPEVQEMTVTLQILALRKAQ
ncbi:MAG: type II secretion system protein GspM [Parahaliea sp.]